MEAKELEEALVKAVREFADKCIQWHFDGVLEDGPVKLELWVSWEGTKMVPSTYVASQRKVAECEVALYSASSMCTVQEQL